MAPYSKVTQRRMAVSSVPPYKFRSNFFVCFMLSFFSRSRLNVYTVAEGQPEKSETRPEIQALNGIPAHTSQIVVDACLLDPIQLRPPEKENAFKK